MSNALKILTLAVVVLTTAVLLVFGFYAYSLGRRGMLAYDSVLGRVFNNSAGPSFAAYDGKSVDGEFIRECIEKFGGEYFIRVRTSKNPHTFCILASPVEGYVPEEEQFSMASKYTEPSSMYYVPANEVFDCTVLREDDEICGVYFEQQKIMTDVITSKDGDASTQRETKITKLDRCINGIDSIDNNLWSIKYGISAIRSNIEKSKKDASIEVSEQGQTQQTLFNNAYNNFVNAKEDATKAFDEMETAFHKAYKGVEIYSHADIRPDGTDDTSSLTYWKQRAAEQGVKSDE